MSKTKRNFKVCKKKNRFFTEEQRSGLHQFFNNSMGCKKAIELFLQIIEGKEFRNLKLYIQPYFHSNIRVQKYHEVYQAWKGLPQKDSH